VSHGTLLYKHLEKEMSSFKSVNFLAIDTFLFKQSLPNKQNETQLSKHKSSIGLGA
jgi:hypothetical protein